MREAAGDHADGAEALSVSEARFELVLIAAGFFEVSLEDLILAIGLQKVGAEGVKILGCFVRARLLRDRGVFDFGE